MEKIYITEANCKTNEIVKREYTDAEYARHKAEQEAEAQKQAEAQAKAEAKAAAQAKLTALGLTVEDLQALGL
jgi:cbb3-type cytochrome oxidase cytochrome c subunit